MANYLVRAAIAAAFLVAAGPAMAQMAPNAPSTGLALDTGEHIFQHICSACHMADAKGATGAATIPALANNVRLTDASYPITMVLFGRGAMPWFTQILNPGQIADVVAYVRTHFGNNYPEPVTEADVTALAAKATKELSLQQNLGDR
jgi:mono/diheme cytochrome c family protein